MNGRIMRPGTAWVAAGAMMLATHLGGSALLAGDAAQPPAATEKAGEKDRVQRVNLAFKRAPVDRVLEYLSRAAKGVNIKISAEDPAEEEELRQMPVTVELQNVTWRAAVDYVAAKAKFVVNDTKEADGVILLERPPRVTMNVQGAKLTAVIKLLAAQSGKNIIPGPAVDKIENVSFDIRDVPWREALSSILKTYTLVSVEEPSGIIRIVSPQAIEAQHEVRVVALKFIQPYGSKYKAKLPTNDYVSQSSAANEEAGVGSLLKVLEQIKSDKAAVSYESRTNTLVLKDTPTSLERMLDIIRQLDREPLQVKVAVRIASYTGDTSSILGTDWTAGLIGTAGGGTWPTTFPFSIPETQKDFGQDAHSQSGNWGRLGPWGAVTTSPWGPMRTQDELNANKTVPTDTEYSLGTMSFSALRATLQFLKTRSDVNLMQAPEIVTMDNQEATIHVGRIVRYAEFYTETTDGGTVSGYREKTPSVVDGVQLIVVPHVCGAEDKVIMEVVPKTEDFADEWEVFGAGTANELRLPKTSSKMVVTKMKLKSNETGVIGGLLTDIMTETERKVPLLGDIPVLNYAFKTKSKVGRKTNVVIFVTPTILGVTHGEDFLEELNGVRDMAAAGFGEKK